MRWQSRQPPSSAQGEPIATRSGREHRHGVGPNPHSRPLRQTLRTADLPPPPQRASRRRRCRGRPPLPALQVLGLCLGPADVRAAGSLGVAAVRKATRIGLIYAHLPTTLHAAELRDRVEDVCAQPIVLAEKTVSVSGRVGCAAPTLRLMHGASELLRSGRARTVGLSPSPACGETLWSWFLRRRLAVGHDAGVCRCLRPGAVDRRCRRDSAAALVGRIGGHADRPIACGQRQRARRRPGGSASPPSRSWTPSTGHGPTTAGLSGHCAGSASR